MATSIKKAPGPVLSAEQWRQLTEPSETGSLFVRFDGAASLYRRANGSLTNVNSLFHALNGAAIVTGDEAALIAALNHTLDDSCATKITRQDIDALEQSLVLMNFDPKYDRRTPPEFIGLLKLGQKLNALLPPKRGNRS